MEEAKRAAEEFSGEEVSEAGFERGTAYAGGRFDMEYYFMSDSGKHITVRYYVQGDEYRPDWGTW